MRIAAPEKARRSKSIIPGRNKVPFPDGSAAAILRRSWIVSARAIHVS
jgi:hypothetical protein